MVLPGSRAAVQQALNPMAWDGLPAIHGTQESTIYGSDSVGVPPSHNGVHHAFFKVRGMKELPQGITEGYQHPALVMDVISRRCRGRTSDNLQQRRIHFHLICPYQDLVIEVQGIPVGMA